MEYPNSDLLKSFAAEVNGNYIERKYHESSMVQIIYKRWSIIFDNYTEFRVSGANTIEQRYARVYASIHSLDNFRFEIYNKNILSSISKIFGAQDISVDDVKFDNKYIIKANNDLKIKTLLKNRRVKDKILSINKVNLEVSDRNGIWEEKLPENEYQLAYFVEEPIMRVEILRSLFELFKEILDQLVIINSIKASS